MRMPLCFALLSRKSCCLILGLLLTSAVLVPGGAFADDLLDAIKSGTTTLDIRLRAEYADAEGFGSSDAYTARTRLGYRTLDYGGMSAYVEFEDIRALDYNDYNAAGLNAQGGKTVIADPEDTELNQLYGDADLAWANMQVRVGRQRLILNDGRFVGNVGWRQNEQTFDAALIESKLTETIELKYAYLWAINRIFGNQRSATTTALDYKSDSHLLDIAWTGAPGGTFSLFGYLLDFHGSDPTANAASSNTIGFLYSGSYQIATSRAVSYKASFARQQDGHDSLTSYGASYYLIEGNLTHKDIATLTIGYEVLGTDDGRAQFMTPLATVHSFNGWADSFLDNGGPSGLRDVYIGAEAVLPSEIVAGVVYHNYHNDHGGGDLGWEIDGVVSHKISANLKLTGKAAYFDGPKDPQIQRFWLQAEYSF